VANPVCKGCAPWQLCTEAGCQDPPSKGTCGNRGEAVAADCKDLPFTGCCAGPVLYFCEPTLCPGGLKSCVCKVDCAAFGAKFNPALEYTCTWGSGDIPLFLCDSELPAQTGPSGDLLCDWYQCVPDCAGKACGDDGCGGSCGKCFSNQVCGFGGKCISGSAGGPGSCFGSCGGKSIDSACWCDEVCFDLGGCCADMCVFCPDMCGGW
jgi:hypothetical protein